MGFDRRKCMQWEEFTGITKTEKKYFPFSGICGQLEAFHWAMPGEKNKMQVHTDLNDYFKKHIKRMMERNEKNKTNDEII